MPNAKDKTPTVATIVYPDITPEDKTLYANVILVNHTPSSTSFPVSSLPSEEFDLLAQFILKIEEEEGEFLACFEEANIGMSGGTKEEAIENLLADILDTFALFSKEETNLGPGPARQLSVLRRYIRLNR